MKSLRDLGNLSGRVALITGGTGHVGSVIADALAEAGAAVAVLDLDLDSCASTARSLRERYGVSVLPLAIDLENEAAVRQAPLTVTGQLGQLEQLGVFGTGTGRWVFAWWP